VSHHHLCQSGQDPEVAPRQPEKDKFLHNLEIGKITVEYSATLFRIRMFGGILK
jgi:hypothetical protein